MVIKLTVHPREKHHLTSSKRVTFCFFALFLIFKNFNFCYYCLFVCHICAWVPTTELMWAENNFVKLGFSFYLYMNFRDWTHELLYHWVIWITKYCFWDLNNSSEINTTWNWCYDRLWAFIQSNLRMFVKNLLLFSSWCFLFHSSLQLSFISNSAHCIFIIPSVSAKRVRFYSWLPCWFVNILSKVCLKAAQAVNGIPLESQHVIDVGLNIYDTFYN